ncbi:MAG: hypothetical protein EXR99_09405 [Gemmataceae bacterium]|nr:hypothetical protein [Gemmataceae bacterium]
MRSIAALAFIGLSLGIFADGPGDNIPAKVRPVPPDGIPVPDAVRSELQKGIDELGAQIASLEKSLAGKPAIELLPDVRIFHNSVRYALTHNEFYDAKEFQAANNQLKLGKERAKFLAEGKAPWTTATGLVVRGYHSVIDGSIQPYGLVVPAGYNPQEGRKHRLDLWCHGRGEKLTELSFLEGRMKSPGEFTPAGALVLHLYGRYCCANKFAGEIDGMEALAHVERNYSIDRNRVVIRGFSMGGAACWQFAVHYPGRWAAAAPGAGFSETPDFLRVFQNEIIHPNDWEKKLFHLYDCTDWALNFANLPVVAYSGDMDKQKQAADIMELAMKKEGLTLRHVIGPKTGHSYHPLAKREINQRIDAIVEKGRDPIPKSIRFTTYTLRYNQCLWVKVDLLKAHWEKATVHAEILDPTRVRAKTANIEGLTFLMPAGLCPLDPVSKIQVDIDGTLLAVNPPASDRSWSVHFRKENGAWVQTTSAQPKEMRKIHGLQGPIDDAFMDSFLMVQPTGKSASSQVDAWVQKEMDRALVQWRSQFRGEARVKKDVEVTEEDARKHHLVLWGTPESNKIMGRVASRLPIKWGKEIVAGKSFSAESHALALVCPNPENPARYVVFNSGFTFRDYDYLNNARQIPRLPDYAVIDLSQPPNAQKPGKIAAAGFFNEAWQLQDN